MGGVKKTRRIMGRKERRGKGRRKQGKGEEMKGKERGGGEWGRGEDIGEGRGEEGQPIYPYSHPATSCATLGHAYHSHSVEEELGWMANDPRDTLMGSFPIGKP